MLRSRWLVASCLLAAPAVLAALTSCGSADSLAPRLDLDAGAVTDSTDADVADGADFRDASGGES
jgi:hypothetical protein